MGTGPLSGPDLATLLAAARACRVCADRLPHEPRPVIQGAGSARLLIIGQAPGRRVHESGIPWNDASGDRLRDWLQIGRDAFYDESQVAIVPMGLCFPGTSPKGGDNPPRPECAPLWQDRLVTALPNIMLTLVIGQYAQAWHLPATRGATMTGTVRSWRDYGPALLPLPHPSWRNTGWLKRNPWFEADLLPDLRSRVRRLPGHPE